MAVITSDVYDLYNPSPVSLKQLSVIVVSLEVWRREINKYRSSRSLKKFCPSSASISSKIIIPNLPSAIYSTIDYYVKVLGHSISRWLQSHHDEIFCYHYNRDNTRVLEYFEDFVCDYDGTIHYARTAERMMNCDRFNVNQKFLIACTYCFEDDIRRIWPALGLKKTDSLYERYSLFNPRFAYWINFLENDIGITEPPIEDLMFDKCISRNRPSLEYFWNLIPSENRLEEATDLLLDDLPSFVRFILPKLNDQQLNELLHENGCDLLYAMLKNSCFDEEVVLSTWIYVKNSMNEIAFTNLVVKMMQSEVTGVYASSELDDKYYNWMLQEYISISDTRDLDSFLQLCYEIWDTAAEYLKRSAARDITSNNKLLNVIFNVTKLPPISREFKLFLAALSFATYEQRNAFWHNRWQCLIYETRVDNIDRIIRLCLRDEDEMTQFKKNIMANHVLGFCSILLIDANFDELNKFVRFLFPDMQATRNFKQRLLQSTFLNQLFDLRKEMVQKPKEFNEFIEDAYDDVDQSTDFKNELMSSPSVLRCLSVSVFSVPLPIKQFTEFIETLVSTERILLEVKTRMTDFLKKEYAAGYFMIRESSFTSLLSWCLEGNEEVSKSQLNSV